jgi:hypothetical protein
MRRGFIPGDTRTQDAGRKGGPQRAVNARNGIPAKAKPPTLRSLLRERDVEIVKLRSVCAEAYQLAGLLSDHFGNPVLALDNLSAAAQGEPLPHKTFLPVVTKSGTRQGGAR